MTHETTLRLSQVDNIVGVKEAGSDMDQIARIMRWGQSDGFRVWSGNDNETFYIMARWAGTVWSAWPLTW